MVGAGDLLRQHISRLGGRLAVQGDLKKTKIPGASSRKWRRLREPLSCRPLASSGSRHSGPDSRRPRCTGSQWSVFSSRWWIGDALGMLIMTPVLLGLGKCAGGVAPFCDRKVIAKTVLLAAAVAAGCYFVFFRPETSYLLFSVFLLILFSAAWAGPPAARVSALVIASAAVWATHIGVGAFAGGTVRENLQNLNLFLAAVSLTGLAVGAFRTSGSLLLPGTVLVAGWVLSGWLYASLDRDRVGYDEARFDKLVNSVESRMHSRLANLRGCPPRRSRFHGRLGPSRSTELAQLRRPPGIAGALSRHHGGRVHPLGAGRATGKLCRRAAPPGLTRFSGPAYAWRAAKPRLRTSSTL